VFVLVSAGGGGRAAPHQRGGGGAGQPHILDSTPKTLNPAP